MPTYVFRCRTCGAAFERRRPIADRGRLAVCECGSTTTDRVIAPFGIGRNSDDHRWSEAPVPASKHPRPGIRIGTFKSTGENTAIMALRSNISIEKAIIRGHQTAIESIESQIELGESDIS